MQGRQPPSDLFDILRSRTAPAHRRLDARLGLLDPPLERARFVRLLDRLLALHRAWEPSLSNYPALAPLLAGRGRILPIARDLENLGVSPHAIAAAPPCPLVVALPSGQAAALGGIYVMEGSTLGGQLIARSLNGADWAPAAGLETFRPYGDNAGAMWREFKRAARTLAPPPAWPEVERGALAMFDVLERWLPGDARP